VELYQITILEEGILWMTISIQEVTDMEVMKVIMKERAWIEVDLEVVGRLGRTEKVKMSKEEKVRKL